jgi:hypothetical protein
MLALRLLLRGEDKNTRNQTMEIAGLGRACCREVKYKKEEKALGTLAERCLVKRPEDRPNAIGVIQELKKLQIEAEVLEKQAEGEARTSK